MIKILLVEDDKIIVASLSEYLNSEGYLVRSVSGQAAAMKLLAEEKADLVLLDVSRFAHESLSPAFEMCFDSPAAWAKR